MTIHNSVQVRDKWFVSKTPECVQNMHFRISKNGVCGKRKEKIHSDISSYFILSTVDPCFTVLLSKFIVAHIMKSIYCIFLAISKKPDEEYNRNFPVFDLGIPFL